MPTETNAAQTETKPKTTRKRARKPSAVPTFLDKTRAEMTAKAKELDAKIKGSKKDLASIDQGRNAIVAHIMRLEHERDRVVAGLAAIDKAVNVKVKAS